MKVTVEKVVPIGRKRNLVRDRSLEMKESYLEYSERIKHVFIDNIAFNLRKISKGCPEEQKAELEYMADTLDLYQAIIFLRIKDFVPCRTCSYYHVLQEQVMVQSIKDVEDVERVSEFMHENS